MCSTRQRLASLLREVRENRGLNLRQAAAAAQIAPSTLSRWEAGTCVPRIPELEHLFNALGIEQAEQTRILASLNVPRAAKSVRSEEVPPSGGALLKAMRHRAGLSLLDVAISLGVATSTVSRWESWAGLPPANMLKTLLDKLNASPEERSCLEASGVAKLKSERFGFVGEECGRELDRIEARMGQECGPSIELQLLQLQSSLWWAQEQAGAKILLRRTQVAYARYLEKNGRYVEAAKQAEASLKDQEVASDSLAVEALRIVARSEVYRWPKKRPHMGLFTLQQTLSLARDDESRSAVLRDMVQYSKLAGRSEEAAIYAQRADEITAKAAS